MSVAPAMPAIRVLREINCFPYVTKKFLGGAGHLAIGNSRFGLGSAYAQ
jgi:hypothetical protein